MDQRVKEGFTADDGCIVKANSHGHENCISEIMCSCVVWFFFFFPIHLPSITFHLIMMMVKNSIRSPYLLAKSRFLFFMWLCPNMKNSGKITCLGVCIAKMPFNVPQHVLL